MTESIKKEWDNLFNEISYEDRVASLADVLALQFLGLVDQKMEKEGISKKEMAEKIGTSASFITQLFRGDRKPNWNILAKMSMELSLDFKVLTEELFKERVQEELVAYHQRWSKTQEYFKLKDQVTRPQLVMSVSHSVEDEYAMAG
ncbi:helix-turn-helix transcriptional regulator [Algoriphagus sp.]|jgi:transcriptional regulator with XRE-family HTH domain|uniref:helix-turn-helix domain-containing protein n=1 Tax=Algoriphagus sp. TaxID=1872435 RepID=UPI00271F6A55|nr:helix-turn-helix transcriptional regulator [Algoriphagus sp.]MDO8966364.1 helix-turn-helix transcriptional regulator [Algoriphagus sp.]MDP3202311.1 helix-turn-helix transcriptional regulator [Algoriphagus sp.]